MVQAYDKQSISILVGALLTALTGTLLAVRQWKERRHIDGSLLSRLCWVLLLLCGISSCILAVVSRKRPAVDHPTILSAAGLTALLSNQLGEVSPYSLLATYLTVESGCLC